MSLLTNKEKETITVEKLPKKIKIGYKEFELSFNQEVFVNIFCAVVYVVMYFVAETINIKYYHGYEEWVTLASSSNIYMTLICVAATASALVLAFIASVQNVNMDNARDLFKLIFSASAIGQIYLGVRIFSGKVDAFWMEGTYTKYIVQAEQAYTELLKATSGTELTMGAYVMLLLVFLVLFTNSKRDI